MKKGFTLAEVLITLGIIGIVAAMTLPSLINNNRTKELQVGLEKGYSLVAQVLELMAYEEGQKVNYENYPYKMFAPVFDKYLVSAKACSSNVSTFGASCLVYRDNETDEDGNSIGFNFGNYTTYNKKANLAGDFMDNGQFLLRNGMAIFIENDGNRLFLSIDVNGIKKLPNRWGHDLFTFEILDNGKLLPMGASGTRYNETQLCSASSSSKYNGIACTNKALNDKDYWKNLPK